MDVAWRKSKRPKGGAGGGGVRDGGGARGACRVLGAGGSRNDPDDEVTATLRGEVAASGSLFTFHPVTITPPWELPPMLQIRKEKKVMRRGGAKGWEDGNCG